LLAQNGQAVFFVVDPLNGHGCAGDRALIGFLLDVNAMRMAKLAFDIVPLSFWLKA